MSAKLYDAEVLRQALLRDFPGCWQGVAMFLNKTYCAVTKEWVEDRFSPYFLKYQQARKQIVYRFRGNQCEHYAIRAGMEAVDLFSQMPDAGIPPEAESLAVGAIMYLRGAGTAASGMHEVNIWYIGGFWREWEPQTRSWLRFTEAERQTARLPIIF